MVTQARRRRGGRRRLAELEGVELQGDVARETEGEGRGVAGEHEVRGSSESGDGGTRGGESKRPQQGRQLQQQAPAGGGDAVGAFCVPVDQWLAPQDGSHGWRQGLVAGLHAELELLPQAPMVAAAWAAAQELAAAATNAMAWRP